MTKNRSTIDIEPYDDLESGVSIEYDFCISTEDTDKCRKALEQVISFYRI